MKPRVLIYDVGGCEGCLVSIMRNYIVLSNIAEIHSKYLGDVNIDEKYDIGIITGAVCINDDNIQKIIKKIRENVKILIAYGSCASVGGITLFSRGGQEPKPEHRTYQSISAVVDVDYSIPGCPPAPTVLVTIIKNLSTGKNPLLRIFAAIAQQYKKLSGFDLMDNVVLSGLCVGCGACVLSCPTHALQLIDKHSDLIVERCIRCGTCCSRCPVFTRILVFKVKPELKLLVGDNA